MKLVKRVFYCIGRSRQLTAMYIKIHEIAGL
jgi:hypothetical protein